MNDLKASDIAAYLGIPFVGDDFHIEGVSSLNNLRAHTVCFSTTEPSDTAVPLPVLMLVSRSVVGAGVPAATSLIVENPREAYAKVVDRFFHCRKVGISPSAVIGEGVTLGEGVFVGEGVVIEDGVTVGADSVIDHGAVIGWGSVIGRNCRIGANVVIGHDGLGTFEDAEGLLRNVRHLGRAIIMDAVEIGPMCTIARGTIDDTVIGENAHIGPQVNVGHNSFVGKNCQIAGRSHISGGVRIGDGAKLWANCTLKDGIRIESGAVVGMGAVVTGHVAEGRTVAALPAISLQHLAKFIYTTKWGKS